MKPKANFFEIQRKMGSKHPDRYVLRFRATKIREYAPIIVAGIVLFVPSLFLLPLTDSVPPLQMCRETLLCASGFSPWGAITSLFLYDSWTNFLSYGVFVLFLAVTQFLLPDKEKWNRQIFLTASMYLVAVAVNVLWVILVPKSASYGSSGVVYAAWGVLVGFSLVNGLSVDRDDKKLNLLSKNRIKRAWSVINLLTLAFFVLYLTLAAPIFLSEGFGVNLFVHALAFLGGFISSYVFWIFNRTVALQVPSSSRS